MGFFSDLKPDLTFFKIKKEEPKPEVPVVQEIKTSVECSKLWEFPFAPPPRPETGKVSEPRRVGGVELVGLGVQLKKAKENIEYCHLARFSRPIVIYGGKSSGKTMLAKAIMQENEITYTVIDLRQIRRPDEIYRQMESFGSYKKGVIFEGAEELTDWSIIDVVNTILSKDEVDLSFERTLNLSLFTIIFTLKKENIYLNLKNVCPIKIGYKRDDYVRLFLRACKKAGHDFPENKVHIDNKVIAFMGGLLGKNIVLFERWAQHLMDMAEKKEKLTVTMDNVMELLPQMLDFDRS